MELFTNRFFILNNVSKTMEIFGIIAYFTIGFVQLFAIAIAIADGIGFKLGVGSFISFLIACFLTYIPLLGSLAGVYGAVNVWDWSVWQALRLFFGIFR